MERVARVLRDRRFWFVFAVALVLRVGLLLAFAPTDVERALEGDGFEYRALALDLRAAYVDHPTDLSELGLMRPPGYPVVVAAVFAVSGRSITAVLALQAFVGAATAAGTYRFARRLTTTSAATVGGILVAVDPASVIHANLLLTETLFAAGVLAAVWACTIAIRERSPGAAALAGVVMGLGTLARPIALYLPVLVVPVLAWRVAGDARARVACAGAFLLAFTVPVGAWAARNAVETSGPVVSTIDGRNMLEIRARAAIAAEDGTPAGWAAVRRFDERHPPGSMDPVARSRRQLSEGLRLLAEHPWGALTESAKGLVRTYVGPGTGQLTKLLPAADGRAADLALALPLAVLLGLSAIGALPMWRRAPTEAVLVLVFVAYFTLLAASTEGYNRFRVPFTPLLAVVAAVGAEQVGRWWSARSTRSVTRPRTA